MSLIRSLVILASTMAVLAMGAIDAAARQGNGLPGVCHAPGVAVGQRCLTPRGWLIQAGQSRLGYTGGPAGGAADPATLSDQEIADLRFMRVEELLMRNVYLTFDSEWDLQVFPTIAEAEQRHMDAMKGLLTRYQLTDPVTTEMEGAYDAFPDEPLAASGDTFGDFYQDLVALGTRSDSAHTQIDPLSVGALLEERSILDLRNAIEATDNEDIATVYESLLCGSRNHLRTFVYQLEEIYGDADYETQIAVADDQASWQTFIDAIIDSDVERCGRRVIETE